MGLIYYPFIAFILFVIFYFEYFLDVDFLNLHGRINHSYSLEYLRRNLIKKESRFNKLYKKKGLFVPHFKVVVFMFFFFICSFVILLIPFIIYLFIGSKYYNTLSNIQDYITWSLLILLLLVFFEVQIENSIICKKLTSKYTEEERRRIIKQIESEWENLTVTDYYLFEYYDKKFKEEKKQNKKAKKSDSKNDDSI